MNRSHDYVPQNAAQFREFVSNLITYVGTNWYKWGLPPDRVEELETVYNEFADVFHKTRGPRTSAQTLALREAQAACARVVRLFVNQFLRFPPVTDVDRVEMGVPNHDVVRTDHKVVAETVDFVVRLSNIRELVVDFWEAGKSNKAKPKGYEGAVIVWGAMDAPPANPDEMTHHTMASRTPFTLHFDEEERGQTVFIALCWQNERGITGPWSEYKSAIVP